MNKTDIRDLLGNVGKITNDDGTVTTFTADDTVRYVKRPDRPFIYNGETPEQRAHRQYEEEFNSTL